MTIRSCEQCRHWRANYGGRCHRPMLLQSGQVLAQHNSGRDPQDERDEKAPVWKSLRRDMADVCGKNAKWWVER